MSTILLVDDIDSKLEQLKWTVNSKRKEALFHTASSYSEALKEINDFDFDLIITDMVMEENNSGFKVLKASKEKNIKTPVIIVTDYENPKIEVESLKNGANDYIKRGSLTFVKDLRDKLEEVLL